MNKNQDTYIPEYNPKKYKNASIIVKRISLILLAMMFIGIAYILVDALIFKSGIYYPDVRGIKQFDVGTLIIMLSLPTCGFGLMSLFTGVLYSRLKQANTIFSEPDAEKRLEGHLKFQKQVDAGQAIATAHATQEFVKKG